MPSIRFRLDPAPLDRVAETVRERYGVAATVVSAEEVRVGGIGGFFARRYLDVTVDVPEPGKPEEWTAHRRGAFDDLVERADKADRRELPIDASAVPPLSTESDAFSGVLEDLQRYASPNAPVTTTARRKARPVVLLKAPGDLVVIAGIGEDAMTVARSLAGERGGAEIVAGGAQHVAAGVPRVTDRRTAFSARARGVENGRATIVAYSIEPGDARLAAHAAALAGIRPDQLWLAVDASRKPEDTAAWVNAVCTVMSVQALAVLRTAWTSTPDTVRALGLPEGWSDAVQ
ncbi:MAG: hypothetical protein KKH51_16305 [Actinobacteria bacterium]|nr:hypothetical protein [Actinomycetota bacterium]